MESVISNDVRGKNTLSWRSDVILLHVRWAMSTLQLELNKHLCLFVSIKKKVKWLPSKIFLNSEGERHKVYIDVDETFDF